MPDDDAIILGRSVDPYTNQVGERLLYRGERHVLVFGPNGSGKGTRLLIPNLLQSTGRSIVVIDPKGELAAVTARYRKKTGNRVVVINPFGILADRVDFEDMQSEGYNPLAALDPSLPSFNVQASLLAEALITVNEKDPHWDESARALVAALIMFTVLEAHGRVEPFAIDGKTPPRGTSPTMARVRELLCAASGERKDGLQFEPYGLPALAEKMMRTHITGLRNKASQFTDWNREIQSIASTAKRHTEQFDDPEIEADLIKVGFDFRFMKERPTTVYLILPPEMMERHAKWLRLVLTAGLQACMRPREIDEPRVLFMLDEFAALGHLSIIETNWALVRGYGVQIMPVLQDLNQLKALYKERWETFIGMAGAVTSFAPNDLTTAKWLSERLGETTKIVVNYNQGENSGSSSSANSSSRNSGNSSGFSFQQTKVPLLGVHRLFGLGEGYMLVVLAGESNVVPAYAPSYWQITRCKERARVNPYHTPVARRTVLPPPRPTLPPMN